MNPVRIVTATRQTYGEFYQHTLLGASLKRLHRGPAFEVAVTCANRLGLPVVYNREIVDTNRDKILVFVHDDVSLDDFFFVQRVVEALQTFDIVGLAGNRRGGLEQCSWAFLEKPGLWDATEHLSGAVGHAGERVSWYGPTPQEVKLLDGLFIAARVETLLRTEVRFDPSYTFHFYDMDFCRTAAEAGLQLGTWPIAVTHGSGGRYSTKEWQSAAATYFAKWRKPT
jgi:Glycosyltransferase like family